MLKAKLLVCVNNKEYSRTALRFACAKAKNTGCPLEMLHVIEPMDYQNFLSMAEMMRQEKREEAEEMLKGLCDQAYEWGGITPSVMLREGMLGDEIIAAIEEDHSINMLLIGTAPESPNRDKLLPFLASQLGTRMQIPMMIIPGNLTELQIAELT